MSLNVDRDLADGQHVRLRGELNTFNARHLVQTLEPLARQGGDLSLDLSHVVFADSGGIRAITLLAKALGDRGELLLISPGGEMARLLELTGMATYPNVRVLTEPEADHEAGELVHAKEDRPPRAT